MYSGCCGGGGAGGIVAAAAAAAVVFVWYFIQSIVFCSLYHVMQVFVRVCVQVVVCASMFTIPCSASLSTFLLSPLYR